MLALLAASLWASSSITQPFLGALADRVGHRAFAALGVVLSSSLLSLVGVVPTVWLLFALVLVGGLGSAALHPVGTALARADGGHRASLAVSLFSAGGQVRFAFGPVVILLLVSSFGLGATPWLMVPGVLLGAALYLLLPPGEPRTVRVTPKACVRCLMRGPVALLVVSGVLADLAFVTFASATPLWLARDQGVASDAAVIGWTLAAFSLGAAAGSVGAGLLSGRVSRPLLIAGSMLLAVVPLVGMLHLSVTGPAFFAAVVLAGVLVYANFPLMIVSAQELAPHAVATASGMLMGLSTGVAGVLYIGVGKLQEVLGLTTALTIGYLALIPAAFVALHVHRAQRERLGR
jgi:FSR family fosmidomycin resistance protein-like MFS transporter